MKKIVSSKKIDVTIIGTRLAAACYAKGITDAELNDLQIQDNWFIVLLKLLENPFIKSELLTATSSMKTSSDLLYLDQDKRALLQFLTQDTPDISDIEALKELCLCICIEMTPSKAQLFESISETPFLIYQTIKKYILDEISRDIESRMETTSLAPEATGVKGKRRRMEGDTAPYSIESVELNPDAIFNSVEDRTPLVIFQHCNNDRPIQFFERSANGLWMHYWGDRAMPIKRDMTSAQVYEILERDPHRTISVVHQISTERSETAPLLRPYIQTTRGIELVSLNRKKIGNDCWFRALLTRWSHPHIQKAIFSFIQNTYHNATGANLESTRARIAMLVDRGHPHLTLAEMETLYLFTQNPEAHINEVRQIIFAHTSDKGLREGAQYDSREMEACLITLIEEFEQGIRPDQAGKDVPLSYRLFGEKSINEGEWEVEKDGSEQYSRDSRVPISLAVELFRIHQLGDKLTTFEDIIPLIRAQDPGFSKSGVTHYRYKWYLNPTCPPAVINISENAFRTRDLVSQAFKSPEHDERLLRTFIPDTRIDLRYDKDGKDISEEYTNLDPENERSKSLIATPISDINYNPIKLLRVIMPILKKLVLYFPTLKTSSGALLSEKIQMYRDLCPWEELLAKCYTKGAIKADLKTEKYDEDIQTAIMGLLDDMVDTDTIKPASLNIDRIMGDINALLGTDNIITFKMRESIEAVTKIMANIDTFKDARSVTVGSLVDEIRGLKYKGRSLCTAATLSATMDDRPKQYGNINPNATIMIAGLTYYPAVISLHTPGHWQSYEYFGNGLWQHRNGHNDHHAEIHDTAQIQKALRDTKGTIMITLTHERSAYPLPRPLPETVASSRPAAAEVIRLEGILFIEGETLPSFMIRHEGLALKYKHVHGFEFIKALRRAYYAQKIEAVFASKTDTRPETIAELAILLLINFSWNEGQSKGHFLNEICAIFSPHLNKDQFGHIMKTILSLSGANLKTILLKIKNYIEKNQEEKIYSDKSIMELLGAAYVAEASASDTRWVLETGIDQRIEERIRRLVSWGVITKETQIALEAEITLLRTEEETSRLALLEAKIRDYQSHINSRVKGKYDFVSEDERYEVDTWRALLGGWPLWETDDNLKKAIAIEIALREFQNLKERALFGKTLKDITAEKIKRNEWGDMTYLETINILAIREAKRILGTLIPTENHMMVSIGEISDPMTRSEYNNNGTCIRMMYYTINLIQMVKAKNFKGAGQLLYLLSQDEFLGAALELKGLTKEALSLKLKQLFLEENDQLFLPILAFAGEYGILNTPIMEDSAMETEEEHLSGLDKALQEMTRLTEAEQTLASAPNRLEVLEGTHRVFLEEAERARLAAEEAELAAAIALSLQKTA